MLDVPQYVIDASQASASRTSSSPDREDGGTIDPATATSTAATDSGAGSGENSTAIIVGRVVGGVGDLAIIVALIVWVVRHHKRKAKSTRSVQGQQQPYSVVQHPPGGQHPAYGEIYGTPVAELHAQSHYGSYPYSQIGSPYSPGYHQRSPSKSASFPASEGSPPPAVELAEGYHLRPAGHVENPAEMAQCPPWR
jgi:hypothetical protein